MGIIMSFVRVRPDQVEELGFAGADEVGELVFAAENPGPSGYLDKAWSGLAYLLRAAESGVELTDAGNSLADENYSVWPVELVRATDERLRALPFDALAAHYDPALFDRAEIYPNIWLRDGGAEGLHYLNHHYGGLSEFFRHAAKYRSAAVAHLG
ncbi:YfbM family protein [Nocardia asteroides]|uniref:YfbM family protein n=1 Tax=Nocardia asteroides TaxID=1824 RepID=UPI001E59533E|nr:YfbM family protein [Nocardia asteroides]UGT60761.1 YfbM family protein [Nocardia asteroides]